MITATPPTPVTDFGAKLEYTIEREEWIDYYIYLDRQRWQNLWHNHSSLLIFLFVLLGFILITAGAAAEFFLMKAVCTFMGDPSYVWATIATLAFCVIAILVGVFYVPGKMRRQWKASRKKSITFWVEREIKRQAINTEWKYVLSTDIQGLLEKGETHTNFKGVDITQKKDVYAPWTEVLAFEITERNLLIQTSSGGYFVVPKRAFGNEATTLDFLKKAERMRKASPAMLEEKSTTRADVQSAIQTKKPNNDY